MSRSLERLAPLISRPAVLWAEYQAARVAQTGLPLSEPEQDIARRVGVAQPERIRVLYVDHIPFPGTRLVRWAAHIWGRPASTILGLTLGYSLFLVARHVSPRLLAHECRHVYQFEQAGSIKVFVPRYLRQVARHGYSESPYEVDARAHEDVVDQTGG